MAINYGRKQLETVIGKTGQDVIARRILAITGMGFGEGIRLRLEVRSNSYKDQCWAHADKWDGDEWRRVYELYPSEMSTKDGLYSSREPVTVNAFLYDLTRLEIVALQIITGETELKAKEL